MSLFFKRIGVCILFFVASQAFSSTLNGRVVHVADGDTLTLLDADRQQHKIRLVGIDAPEKKQPFGQRSRQSLSDLVAGRVVTADVYKRDRYGRTLAKIVGPDGRDINLEQVRRGMAWHYKQYAKEQKPSDRVVYAQVEDEAERRRVGLWADPTPVPPWDFRKQSR